MNDLNPVELQRWKPRQPSPRTFQRIFGHAPQSDLAFHFRDLSRWLVPAAGCFLLVMGSLSTHFPTRYAVEMAEHYELPPLTEEGALFAALPGAQHHSGVNSYPAKQLEWSLPGRASTAVMMNAGSILISYTNKLIQ